MTDEERFHDAASGRRPFSDFEWYALDRQGHVAFFTSGGLAPIPLPVFRSWPGYSAANGFFQALGARGGYRLHAAGAAMPRPADWVEMAERGLFAYDWCDPSGTVYGGPYGNGAPSRPYRLIASPADPLTVDALPAELREWLQPLRFEALEFAVAPELFVEPVFPELNG